jgi:hypothetical protein
MRFGLCDPRNYDSIELARSLSWLVPLYEPTGSAVSSRSEVNWSGVMRASERLRKSSIGAIVASTPPPTGEFARFERVDRAWIAWLDAERWADFASLRAQDFASPEARIEFANNHGKAEIAIDAPTPGEVVVRETWDPGWRARIDGKPAILRRKWGVFLALDVEEGVHKITLEYDPVEVRAGLAISIGSAVLLILVLTGIGKL